MKSIRTKIAALAVAAFSINAAYAEEFLVGSEVPLTGTLARVGTGNFCSYVFHGFLQFY